jgi:hypothetical protein
MYFFFGFLDFLNVFYWKKGPKSAGANLLIPSHMFYMIYRLNKWEVSLSFSQAVMTLNIFKKKMKYW